MWKKESSNSKRHTHPNVQSSTIPNSQATEEPKGPSTGEWIKRMWGHTHTHTHTHTLEYYPAIKTNEINNAIWSNRDGPRDYRTKPSQSERQIPYAITYMWNRA